MLRTEVHNITKRIEKSLTKLATYKDNLPDTNSAKELAAGELYLASEVKKRADTLLKAAQERALIAGVIIDKEMSDLEPKQDIQLYDGKNLTVTVSVREGATIYPVAAIRTEMARAKLSPKTIENIMNAAARQNRNAHTFHAILKTTDNNQD